MIEVSSTELVNPVNVIHREDLVGSVRYSCWVQHISGCPSLSLIFVDTSTINKVSYYAYQLPSSVVGDDRCCIHFTKLP